MLPLLVGGPEPSLNSPDEGPFFSRDAPQDQLFRDSGALPFANGGVAGRDASVRAWEAL